MELFGDVLFKNGNTINYEVLEKLIRRPFIKPRYRVCVLNPDETVAYEIPSSDILMDGISYTENYQNGQRKNITLQLINTDGKYTPSINSIWVNTKFSFEIGIQTKGNNCIWFPKGIYIMGDVNLTNGIPIKTVSIQLKDKFAIFEGKWGTLEDPYEIETGSDAEDAIRGILNFSMGNGYILDYKEIILDQSLKGFKTQVTIRANEGDNLGTIIKELATQMSAEYYYNNVGNLCFYPINETVDDSVKPVIWTFEELTREMGSQELTYQNENIVNVVKVVGDNVDNEYCSAVVMNENPTSPICIQQVGRRVAPKYSESNIWNDELAYDLAKYYLRKASFVAVDFSSSVGFNPILAVNNICEVESNFLGLKREKLLITSISFSSGNGQMSLSLCNTKDLPSFTRQNK